MVVGSLLLIVAAVALLGYGLVQGANAAFVASIAASLLAAVALIVGGRKAAAAREDQREIQQERERRRAARAAETSRGGSAGGDEFGLADSRRGQLDEDRQPVAVGAGAVGHADETSIFTAPREEAPYRDDPPYRDETAYRDDAGYRDETPYRDESAYRAQGSYREDYATDERGIPTQSAVGADQGYAHDDDDDEEPPNEPPAQLTSPGDAARVARMSTEVLVVDGRPRYHKPGCVHLLGRQSEPLPVSEAVELGFTPCSLCEPDSALLAEARRV